MSNAILVPGRPDKDHHYDPTWPCNNENYWFPWLRRQLILRDIHAVAIEPPFPFRPRWDEWVKEFERFDLTPDTMLIGHSCGGGFLIRYLSEHPDLHVGKVALVAPWTNPFNYPKADTANFFDFTIDPDFPARTKGVTVFVSSDDEPSVPPSVELLRKAAPAVDVREYTDRGHFTEHELPELLTALVGDAPVITA